MTQQALTVAAATIPAILISWFVYAIAQRIYTRCRQMPTGQLAQVNRAIATAATAPPKALPIQPSVTSDIAPLVIAQTPQTGTRYQSLSLAELRKVARKRGINPAGDARKREAWIDALLANQ